jgi:hypothetical protein
MPLGKWMDEWMDGWMNRQMDEHILSQQKFVILAVFELTYNADQIKFSCTDSWE